MRSMKRLLFGVIALMMLPTVADAQASIAGMVRTHQEPCCRRDRGSEQSCIDREGSLSGDGQQRPMRIVDLRPGIYVVTFTLTGFSTVRREGIELSEHSPRPSTPT